MTKTIEEMREEFLEEVKADYKCVLSETVLMDALSETVYVLDPHKVADYWLSVIEQRDRELREKIEKLETSRFASINLKRWHVD